MPRLAACALAWALALAALLLPAELVWGRSRFALCALAWAALLGLPRARAARGSAAALAAAASTALAAPPLGLALGLDAASGTAPRPFLALAAVLQILLLALAAEVAARRAGGLHSLAWAGLVAGAPLFAAACAWAGAAPSPDWLAQLASASPLGWLADLVVPERARLAPPWLPAGVAAAALLAALAAPPARR